MIQILTALLLSTPIRAAHHYESYKHPAALRYKDAAKFLQDLQIYRSSQETSVTNDETQSNMNAPEKVEDQTDIAISPSDNPSSSSSSESSEQDKQPTEEQIIENKEMIAIAKFFQTLREQINIGAELGLHNEDIPNPHQDPWLIYTNENGKKGMKEAAAHYLIQKYEEEQRQRRMERREEATRQFQEKLKTIGISNPQAAFAKMKKKSQVMPTMNVPPDTPRN